MTDERCPYCDSVFLGEDEMGDLRCGECGALVAVNRCPLHHLVEPCEACYDRVIDFPRIYDCTTGRALPGHPGLA